MSIRIVNLRNYKLNEGEVLIKIDRSSVLGNPFFMSDESKRNEVCDKYETYFDTIVCNYMNSAHELTMKENAFVVELSEILRTAKEHDIALACWCFPKRCHGETIKKFIENFK